MSSLPSLKYRALDSSGDPISGAKLYFYEDGTTTPLDTYSDEALTSANANPVVADANGWFGEIYLKTDEAYKVKLTDASDVQVWVVDDINASQLTSASVITRQRQIASNPIDYGALGDGVADESSEVQEAIDAATGVVDLLGKTYRCDSAINLASGITLKNGTLDFTQCGDDEYVRIVGTVGSPVALTANATIFGINAALTSASGISSGDYLIIKSSKVWSTLGGSSGEMVHARSVAGSTVTISGRFQNAYNTADTAQMEKLTPALNVVLEDLVITSSKSASGTGHVVYADAAVNLNIRNVKCNGFKGAGFLVRRSENVSIVDCVADEDNGAGVGFYVAEASRNVVIDRCTASRADVGFRIGGHVTLTSGQATLCSLLNSFANGCDDGVYIDANSQNIKVVNCNLISTSASQDGIYAEGTGITISGCDIHHPASGIVWESKILNTSIPIMSVTIEGNYLYRCTTDGVILDLGSINAAGLIYDFAVNNNRMVGNVLMNRGVACVFDPLANIEVTKLEICGNKIDDCSQVGISVDADANVDIVSAAIDSNIIHDCGTDGIYVFCDSRTIGNLSVSGNKISEVATATDYCIYVKGYVDRALISRNICSRDDDLAENILVSGDAADSIVDLILSNNQVSNGLIGISVNTAKNVNISNNAVQGATDCVAITDVLTSHVIGNQLVAGGAGTGILLDGANGGDNQNCIISGNSVSGVTGSSHYCLHIKDFCDFVSVTGNVFVRGDDTQVTATVAGLGAGNCNNVVFSGNIFSQGTYGIAATNHTAVLHDGNIFHSMATGPVFGAWTDGDAIPVAAVDHP